MSRELVNNLEWSNEKHVRKEIERYATLKGQADRNVEYQIATQLQVDKLCRGSQLRVITKFDIIL